jgi:hypothetical protein
MDITQLRYLFIKRIKDKDCSRKGLKGHVERIVKKRQLLYAGFVAMDGAAAGRPLIYFPEDLTVQKELCGKIVGIVKEITNLKISNMDNFSEMTFSNSNEYLYLKEIQSHILFYCVSQNKKQIEKVSRFLLKNKEEIESIFTKD